MKSYDDITLNIRAIQHFMYCPRRFGLLEINNDWAENFSVIKANLMHENVHNGDHNFTSKSKIAVSSVAVYNDMPEYNIYGITDCIEFERCKSGVFIPQLNDNFTVKIVEYKPKPPKNDAFHESDAIQVFAQKLCADYIWGGNSECYLYYSEVRRRVKLPFESEFEKYNAMLIEYLASMRRILAEEKIPVRKIGQKCSGCSMSDVCFPKSSFKTVKSSIMAEKEI